MEIKHIIFDFDGTLVDTAPLIVATMQATIAELGLPQKTDAQCRSGIGLRLNDIASFLWPDTPIDNELFATTYRAIFDRLKRPLNVKCFPGVIDTIHRLHDMGFGMAIASSRSHKSLDEYVGLFNLEGIFSKIVGGNDVANGKPAPDPVLAITNDLHWRPENTLVVGDAAVDILMGKAAGAITCAVSYGNGTPEELAAAKPDYTISHFPDILKIVS